MAYITQGDLDEYLSENLLIQLTDDDNTKSIDSAKVAECIEGGEAHVNAAIAHRYTTPITSPPDIITELAVIFTTLRLYARRNRVPEAFQAIADQGQATLDKIADGSMLIDADPVDFENEVEVVEMTTQRRVHTRSTWSGW